MSFNYALSEYSELCELVTVLDAPGKGGNISVKFDEMILIKSSGQNMKQKHTASVCDEHGIVICDHNFANNTLVKPSKPSMEIDMHLALKSKYVFHYHPVYVLPYLCSTNFEPLYKKGKVIDYVNPGSELAAAVNGLTDEVIWLKNHGLILQSNSINRIKRLYNIIKSKYFIHHSTFYTPDDVVDDNNLELWLFRQYIELIAIREDLNLAPISAENSLKLIKDPNEQYRMNGAK